MRAPAARNLITGDAAPPLVQPDWRTHTFQPGGARAACPTLRGERPESQTVRVDA